MSFGVAVNGVPLYFDGFPKHSTRSRFDPASGVVLRFALENFGFTGADDGLETIEVELKFYDSESVARTDKVTRKYASYRHTREPNTFELRHGEAINWTGKYQPSTKVDRYEIMLASSKLAGIQKLKTKFDGLGVFLPEAQIVGVVRPPRNDYPITGMAFGLKFPSGQVKSTFDYDAALDVCRWLIGKKTADKSLNFNVLSGDEKKLKKLVSRDMYLYHFDPEKFTDTNDRGSYAGPCSRKV